jgi:hypothetical protein
MKVECKCGLKLVGLNFGPVAGSCKYSSINYLESFDHLSGCKRLKSSAS